MTRQPDPRDTDPLTVPDDDRIPRGWEHQRTPRRNWGCLWALAATALFWVVVVAVVAGTVLA